MAITSTQSFWSGIIFLITGQSPKKGKSRGSLSHLTESDSREEYARAKQEHREPLQKKALGVKKERWN